MVGLGSSRCSLGTIPAENAAEAQGCCWRPFETGGPNRLAKFAPAWLSKPFGAGACVGAYALLVACATNKNLALCVDSSAQHKRGAFEHPNLDRRTLLTILMQIARPQKPCRLQNQLASRIDSTPAGGLQFSSSHYMGGLVDGMPPSSIYGAPTQALQAPTLHGVGEVVNGLGECKQC